MTSRPRIALVIGGAECVWTDLEKAHALFEPDIVVVANHIGTIWPHHIDHWVSHHAALLAIWAKKRRENGLLDAGQFWTGPGKFKKAPAGIHQHDQRGGSSGLLATCVALDHADLAALAGVPIDPKMRHWHDAQNGKPWKDGANYLAHWRNKLPGLQGRVKSFSGWTREMLGEPTREWLYAAELTKAVL